MATYKATVGLTNDKTGKDYQPGDTVTDKDFPATVVKEWLAQGVLVPAGKGEVDGHDNE